MVRGGNATDHGQSWFTNERSLYTEQANSFNVFLCSLYEGHHVVKELVLVVGNGPMLQDQDKQGVDSQTLRQSTASSYTTKSSLCPLSHLACIAQGIHTKA